MINCIKHLQLLWLPEPVLGASGYCVAQRHATRTRCGCVYESVRLSWKRYNSAVICCDWQCTFPC